MNAAQLVIDFEAGLVDQYPRWSDCVRAAVYGCGRPFKAVAADLDLSVSMLSRMLADNPDTHVHFPLDRLDELLAATGDQRPIFWLVERFVQDSRTRQAQDAHRLRDLLRQLEPLAARMLREDAGA